MRTANLRLWLLAVLTVVVGSWWQLPILSADGSDPPQRVVYVAGQSTTGHLGGFAVIISPPRLLAPFADPLDDVLDAAMGVEHTMVLRTDGTVWSMGRNNRGQLGLGSQATDLSTLQQIPGLPVIVAIAAGGYHSLAIDDAGDVWAWGDDAQGQLGLGETGETLQYLPQRVQALSGATSVAAGADFSLAVLGDGTIQSWGANLYYQLGGAGNPRNLPGPVPAPATFTAIRVAAGDYTALALSSSGDVIGWGRNNSQQIVAGGLVVPVVGPIAGGISDIAVGAGHIVLARSDGRVATRGLGTSGQLGNGNLSSSSTFFDVPGLTGIVDVDAGFAHSLAVSSSGAIWSWGWNQYRQLGTPSTAQNVSAPMQVTGIPMTGRKAVARGNSTILLNDPGTLSVTVAAPLNVSCTTPFAVSLNVTGFNTVNTGPSDIVLVLDESGSIGSADFTKMKQFAIDFVNAQDMTRTRVGVVFFATNARVIAHLTSDRPVLINAIQNASYGQGSTCIGCGVAAADDLLDTEGKTDAARVMVIATDGVNNQQVSTFNTTITTAQQTSALFAVGIADAVDAAQIDFIASDIPGVQTAFMTTDFNTLSAVVSQLAVTVTAGLRNVQVDLVPSPSMALTGSLNASSGNVSATNGQIRWTLASLGAATATLNLSMRGTGTGGEQPLFQSIAYFATNVSPQTVASPATLIVGCPASLTLEPSTANHLVGETHLGAANLLDDFGATVSQPISIQVTAGPNAGRTFKVTPIGTAETFTYSSNVAGIDELVATIQGSPLSASATVAWELPNSPPSVNVSPDQTIALDGSPTATFALEAMVFDDGRVQPLQVDWLENGVSFTKDLSTSLTRPAGVYTFTFTAFDGELSTSRSTTVTIVDPTAPLVTYLIDGIAGANNWYVGPVTLTWQIADPETAVSTHPCADATFTQDGAHAAQCSATSGGGTTSLNVAFAIDQAPPVVVPPAAVTAEATDSGGAIVSYAGESATDATSGLASLSCTPASGRQFPIGTTTVRCTATDAAGLTASAGSTVTVQDTTPPDLADLADITETGSHPAGKAVMWAVSAADAVGPVTTVCAPASGSTFDYGTTPVTCTATDAYHNQDVETFTVTITDGTPPEISAAVNGTTGDNNWFTSDVTVEFTVADPQSGISSSNGCLPAIVSSDGSSSFTCSATSAGGTTTRAVSVLRDATAPTLGLPANITLPATSAAGASVSFAVNPDDATSGLGSSSCSHASGATFAIGSTAVTCTASDNAGNTAGGSFTITVSDTIPPVIGSATPSITTIDSANHRLVPVTIDVLATDNIAPPPVCSIAGVTSNEPQNGLGDGDTPNDWLIVPPLTVELRAERSGTGNGRVYTIAIQCVDGSGNTATTTASVSVPKGRK